MNKPNLIERYVDYKLAEYRPADSWESVPVVCALLASILAVYGPFVYVWFRLGAHMLGGNEATFAFTHDAKGTLGVAEDLMPLIITTVYAFVLHVMRWMVIVLTCRPDRTVKNPRATSFILGFDAQHILIGYGVTFLWWAMFFTHSQDAKFWPFLTFLLFHGLSYFMMRNKYAFGWKVVDETPGHAEPVKVRSTGDAANALPASPQNVARSEVSSLRFSDIYGNTETKRRLLEAGKVITNRRKEGASPRNGIMLFGEPGNGKTIFAEALAGELNLPLLKLTHGDVASQWVGERSVKIKAAFDQAYRTQPCVLFIDEIDSFVPDRSNAMTSSNKEDSDVVNTLLTLLVDVRKSKVVVVAATNYLDRLDSAATREGRFDFKVEITPPDEEARIGLLRSGVQKNLRKAKVSEEVIINVAKRWNGFSVKRILAVTEELPSYLRDRKSQTGVSSLPPTFDDFMAALRRTQGRKGAAPENVLGMHELILPARTREALEMIAGRLNDPVRVERLGGTLPTGVLFYGPPGTGKTAACKALAKEVGSAFLIATGADLARDVKALEKLHAQAKELRPAIIFIDEADDLLRAREYSANSEATNKLLTLMDGTNDRVRDVLWIAATNNPDQIDAALLRGGRFTEKVEFVRPDEEQLAAHIKGWLAKRKITLGGGLIPEKIAGMLGDESIANADAVMQHAVNRVISRTTKDVIQIFPEDVKIGMSTVLGNAS